MSFSFVSPHHIKILDQIKRECVHQKYNPECAVIVVVSRALDRTTSQKLFGHSIIAKNSSTIQNTLEVSTFIYLHKLG